jgi:GT2 family glycosyltransferase
MHVPVLADTVASVKETREPDSEVILIDDGSSIELEGFQYEVDTFVRRRQNRGIAASWNEGLKLARGEYIAIINDDIIVNQGWLDKLRQALEFEDDYWISAPGVEGQQNGVGIEESYQWFPGYCFMLKREVLDTIGLFDEQFSPFDYEDTDYWTRVLQQGKKLVRNYSTTIKHVGGHVLHTLDYDNVNNVNNAKFQTKWGFDPIPVFYYGKEFDFTTLKHA